MYEHIHGSMLVNIFGDKFDFSTHKLSSKNNHGFILKNQDGDTIHRHSTGVELEFLFNSMNIAMDDKCFVFPDGRQFCTNEDYSLKYYLSINNRVEDLRNLCHVQEGDRILITYGNEDELGY